MQPRRQTENVHDENNLKQCRIVQGPRHVMQVLVLVCHRIHLEGLVELLATPPLNRPLRAQVSTARETVTHRIAEPDALWIDARDLKSTHHE